MSRRCARPTATARSLLGSRPRCVLGLALVAMLLTSLGTVAAQGVTQASALAFGDPSSADLEQAIRQAESANAIVDGFSYSLSARPSIEVSGPLAGDDDPSWSSSFAATATLSYRHSFVAPIRNVRDLERARFDLATAERDGILRALRAHVTWWTQTRALSATQVRYDTASAALDEGARGFEDGATDLATMHGLQLAYDRADLAVREAAYRYAVAVADANTYGLTGIPSYAALRFELPEPDLSSLYAVTFRTAALEEAEANAFTTGLFRVPREVRLSGSYGTSDLDLSASVGVFRSVPGANVSIGYPGPRSTGWSVGVSAEFVVDDGTLDAMDTARTRVDTARDTLTRFLLTYSDDVAAARTSAGFAEENLTLAERSLDLEERAVDDLTARLHDARRRLEGATAEDAATVEREVAALARDLDRALTNLDRAEGALLSAWNTYVGQVHAYLRLTENRWIVR